MGLLGLALARLLSRSVRTLATSTLTALESALTGALKSASLRDVLECHTSEAGALGRRHVTVADRRHLTIGHRHLTATCRCVIVGLRVADRRRTSDDRFDPEASSDSGSDSDDSSGDIWLSGDDQHGENENEGFQMDVRDRECSCRTVLVVHAEAFRSVKRQGGDLKKRCKYMPKGDKDGCYRDINQQNDLLLSNVFDASGNYLYYCTCVQSILGVSRPRLARLRKIKQGLKPAKHGLSAVPSNHSDTDLKKRFLEFVDHSRSPNGRRLGSSSAQYYFDAAYTSFRMPDKKDPKHEEKMKRSVVGSVNLS